MFGIGSYGEDEDEEGCWGMKCVRDCPSFEAQALFLVWTTLANTEQSNRIHSLSAPSLHRCLNLNYADDGPSNIMRPKF